MSWDDMVDNFAMYGTVATNRLARRALVADIKSRAKLAENEDIAEWLPFIPEKRLTKSLREDIQIILAKKLADRINTKTTSKQDKQDKQETCPPNDIDE